MLGFPWGRRRVGTLLVCAALGSGAYLAARGESPARTEGGDAPAGPGATSEHIGPYVSEEQRRPAGRSAGRMPADFHHGLRATVSGQNVAPAPPMPALPPASLQEFTDNVLPILSNTCMACHNDVEVAGDLNMEMFFDPKAVAEKPDVWVKVLDMLTAGKMPPRSVSPLAPAEAAAVIGWIERTYGLSAAHRDPATADPGRVTARRLNRTEYNNTVRDLLGVTLRPADEFPVDDAGYGFDNIGDVLTISPMLMEKYMRAARAVSRAAVFGERYPERPTLIVKLQPKKDQDDLPATGNILPFSIRGALYGTYRFPVDAEYEFRWRYGNTRGNESLASADAPAARAGGAGARGAGRGAAGRGANVAPAPDAPGAVQAGAVGAPGAAVPVAGRGRGVVGRGVISPEEQKARDERERTGAPPELMVFTIDGEKVYDFIVEGTINHNYTRGENVVRVKLAAGDHALRISWPGYANVANATAQYGPDGRRKLFVDYLDIHGPFNPSKAPPAGFKTIFICGAPDKYTPQCARQIVERLATRAYRRPATPQEVQRLLTLVNQVQKQDSFEEGIRVAVEAISDVAEFPLQNRTRSARRGRGRRFRRPRSGAFRRSHRRRAGRRRSGLPDQRLRAGIASVVLPLEQHA